MTNRAMAACGRRNRKKGDFGATEKNDFGGTDSKSPRKSKLRAFLYSSMSSRNRNGTDF